MEPVLADRDDAGMIGVENALDLLLSARVCEAWEAKELGLVSRGVASFREKRAPSFLPLES